MFHPWRRLRELEHIDLAWLVMPGLLGCTNGFDEIHMHPGQLQVERRCTIAHELAHVELGHTAGCVGHDERAARELAARWLIRLADLAAALRWGHCLSEVADELWVDADTLQTRLDTLTAAERRHLDDAHHTLERGC